MDLEQEDPVAVVYQLLDTMIGLPTLRAGIVALISLMLWLLSWTALRLGVR